MDATQGSEGVLLITREGRICNVKSRAFLFVMVLFSATLPLLKGDSSSNLN